MGFISQTVEFVDIDENNSGDTRKEKRLGLLEPIVENCLVMKKVKKFNIEGIAPSISEDIDYSTLEIPTKSSVVETVQEEIVERSPTV